MPRSTRFKSASASLPDSLESSTLRGVKLILSSALIVFSLSSLALAETVVAPFAPYTFDSNGTLYVTDSDTASSVTQAGVDTAAGFRAFSATIGFDTGPTNANTLDLLFFDIYSTETFTGAGQLIAGASVSAGGSFRPVPIAYSNGAFCTAVNCQNKATLNVTDYYYGAKYGDGLEAAKTPLRIGIYLKDLCAVQGGSLPDGCSSTTELNARTSRVTFTLRFQVALVTLDVAGVPDADAGQLTEEKTLVVKTGVPTVTCPSTYGDVYFPGDGSISFFPASAFSSMVPESVSSAPIDTVIVAGLTPASSGTSPSGSTYSSYPLLARVPVSLGSFDMGGFRNTTNGSDNVYSIYFSARDVSGAFSAFSTSCAVHTVQTSQILPFLKKGNCFIATAAHADPDAPGVRLLREFRDRILSRSKLGRTLTRIYYQHSPQAATWLMDHPVYRIPVLRALSAVELLAALLLRPGLALALFIAAVAVMGYRPRRSI